MIDDLNVEGEVMLLDKNLKKDIVKAIREAEKLTSGEIRVHIQSKCSNDPFFDGKKIFKKLQMDKTKEKNGVLIFIALKSKKFAILGDKGIHEKVGEDFWNDVRDTITEYFHKDQFQMGIVTGVGLIGEKLKKYFPRQRNDKNELPNTVSES